ncbi:MAG: type II toxin-antitoxin system RelB/DinJ family antitoxin [Calditrichaceae bacterium]|nr:type II toxin-antitoxin system RelB/DinJ family antitoxin [Calditrichia bacterium]NUQ43115.1 type II toxin-antitoxin system RelB/DinJ family antitoxin [Calditrichaceae bacterium]
MAKEAKLSVHLDPQLKDDVEEILKTLGISAGEAISLFFAQIRLHKGLPFEIKIPNEKTVQALRQTQRDKDKLKTYQTPEELFEEMDKW